MRGGFGCKFDYLMACLKCYIKDNKRYLLCLLAAICGGLVLGIVVCSLRSNITSKYNYIVLISNEQFNVFGTFIKVLLLSLCGMAACYLLLLHKYLACMPYIVLFYAAYRLGARLVGLIVCDKFVGFLCIITFTLPMYLSAIACFVFAACICAHYRVNLKGGFVCRNINAKIFKYLGCVCFVHMLVLVVVCIIVPSVAKFIIVV